MVFVYRMCLYKDNLNKWHSVSAFLHLPSTDCHPDPVEEYIVHVTVLNGNYPEHWVLVDFFLFLLFNFYNSIKRIRKWSNGEMPALELFITSA